MSEPGNSERELIEIRGCVFPRRLIYDVPNHIWYERLDNGSVRVGMTCVGSALASFRIFAVTPRRVGREFEAGTSIATIESSKWVGPARVAFDGVVEAINDALMDNPSWLADHPYERGWILVARPRTPNALDHLVQGDDIERAYLDWMNNNDFPGCDRTSE